MLINFHVALIKDGIARIVNGLQDDHAKSPGRKEARKYLVSISLGRWRRGLLVPQSGHGIYPRRAPGGEITSQRGGR